MKRYLVYALITLVTIFSFSPAVASSKSVKLTQEFQNFLTDAQARYSESVSEAEQEFQPVITDAQQRIQTAVQTLKSANLVKVLKLGTNRSYWGQFDCPASRPNCIGVDKGPEFQVGEVITIKDIVLQDLDQLYVMQLILQDGLVELQSSAVYLSAVDSFRSATKDLAAATNYLIDAKIAASAVRLDSLQFSDAIKAAKVSAKRADKFPRNYDKAFSSAFIFEYNRIALDKYASTPFLEINSVKALNNTIALAKLSAQADAVANSYTFENANRLNRLCGNTFISEQNFKTDFALIAKLYKKVTKSSISSKL